MLIQIYRMFILILAGLFLASCAKPNREADCGFVQNVYGERVSWKSTAPVKIYLHTSIPADYETAIRAAAQTWNRAFSRTVLEIEPSRVGGGGPVRDSKNVIYYMKTWEADKISEQARTSLYWVGDLIQEADIRINGQNYAFYTSENRVQGGVNIEALVLHELGHVLGLRHNDATPSVMATYLKSNQDRTTLQQADLASLTCEY